jgi:putative ABC transport system permease protein
MSSFGVDLRNASRSLARSPGMALSAVFCLALGIGGTTAVASAISRALLQPLPVRDPDQLVEPRFYVSMLSAFAAVALALAIAGLYGVLSYAVAQRTRELGIRVALGSSRARLVTLVTRDGMSLVVAGVALGLAGGYALMRLMVSILYGVSPVDAVTWALAVVSLFVPTMLATVVPALRASRADPIVAMRVE